METAGSGLLPSSQICGVTTSGSHHAPCWVRLPQQPLLLEGQAKGVRVLWVALAFGWIRALPQAGGDTQLLMSKEGSRLYFTYALTNTTGTRPDSVSGWNCNCPPGPAGTGGT